MRTTLVSLMAAAAMTIGGAALAEEKSKSIENTLQFLAQLQGGAPTKFSTKKAPCYSKKNCKSLLIRNVTKANCEAAGGKSWDGPRGCENL